MKNEVLTTEGTENTEAVQVSGNSGAIKERPILFNGEMVRAILDGRKTQTGVAYRHADSKPIACPFGKPGDLLWVRETFRIFDASEECACYDDCHCSRYNGKPVYRADGDQDGVTWTPSIHMPREHSRITLRVTRAWVEPLWRIKGCDVIAEGVESIEPYLPVDAIERFDDWETLWDSIYGKTEYKVKNNPWVWACEFEVVGVSKWSGVKR